MHFILRPGGIDIPRVTMMCVVIGTGQYFEDVINSCLRQTPSTIFLNIFEVFIVRHSGNLSWFALPGK